MTEQKHTPGPWSYHRSLHNRSINGAYINASDGSRIATVSRNADRHIDEKEANARLIAAAPDLLAALIALMPADFDEHPQDFAPEWHTARAAIGRATGNPT